MPGGDITEFLPALLQCGEDFPSVNITVEGLGVLADQGRVPLAGFELFHGLDQGFGSLILEEQAAFSILNGFQCAAFAVGENGPSAGLGFQGGDAEIFESGKQEGPAAPVGFAYFRIFAKAEESNAGTGVRSEAARFRSVADYVQAPLGGGAGFNREVDSLVGNQPADGEVCLSQIGAALDGLA